MLGFLLPLILLGIIVAICRKNNEPRHVLNVVVAAYVVRMLLQTFLRDLPVFSYGSGGDCIFYEWCASNFARLWIYRGIEIYTSEQFVEIGNAALPINLFALIIYLNGDTTRAGCTAVVAMCSVLACYQIYRLAVDLGADREKAYKTMGVLVFLPGYLYYTADMYKDGIVAFFVLTALTSSFRLSKKFSVANVVLATFALVGLWYVRHYLVFLAVAPLLVGLVGLGKGSIARQVVLGAGVIAVFLGAMQGSAFENVATEAQNTFNRASDVNSRQWNQIGGSGVAFDDGGQAFGALHIKIIYTLFSPFPWQGGSFAMQMGKVDTLVWYYMFWRMMKVSRRFWSTDRSLLLMFLVFMIPLTVAYATTMANIGLILRQRIPIVFVGAMLGILSWPARAALPVARVQPGRARQGAPGARWSAAP
jgi:hypothetical protein